MPIYALGDDIPEIHPDAYISPDAVIIGRVRIGARSSIWPGAVLRGDDGDISVGEGTSIQDGSVLHTTVAWPTVVGSNCTIGHIVHLEACIIEDGALVGNGAVVLHRVVVCTGAVVGSNAVVTAGTIVPAGAMALGVPARIKENAVRDPFLIDGPAASYVARAERYRTQLRRID